MQLDLFAAEVVVFPAERSLEVGRMVRFLLVVQGERADAYYRKVCRKMVSRLRKCGASEAQIRREVEAFNFAVRVELERITAPAAIGAEA